MPDAIKVKQIEEIAAVVTTKINLTKDLRGPLQTLASRAREDETLESTQSILDFANNRAKKERPGKWKRYPELEDVLELCKANRSLFRFALEALLIQIGKEDRS
jgi:hypothetical protein